MRISTVASLVLALMLGGCAQEQDTGPQAPRQVSPQEAGELAARIDQAICDLEEAAAVANRSAAWTAEAPPEHTSVGGRDAAAWRALVTRYEQAAALATDADAFVAYWEKAGGDTDPYDYLALGQRLAAGDAAAIAELRKREASSFASMMAAALHRARAAGDRASMEVLANAMVDADLPPRDRAGLSAYLHELGREDEAQKILTEVTAKGEPVALGSAEAGMFMVRFVDEGGMESGFEHFRQLFGEAAVSFGIAGAVAEYRDRGNPQGLAAFVASAPVAARIDAASETDVYFLAPVVVAIEQSVGPDAGLDAATRLTRAMQASSAETGAQDLARLAGSLAHGGCSNACLAVPVEAIEAAAKAQGSSPSSREALQAARAATGQLERALEDGADPSALMQPAVQYAVGRQNPDYVQPLLRKATPEVAAETVSRLTSELYWRDAPKETIAGALRLAPADAKPDTWWNLLAGSAVHGEADAERRTMARRLLVAWAEGLCGGAEVDPAQPGAD
ncbi:MAG TPA: hypothetical protein VFG21_09825 [Xanthomonadaceae bacterium]|nr:hypothetical protein [Xanthomonadaceae bacterium]